MIYKTNPFRSGYLLPNSLSDPEYQALPQKPRSTFAYTLTIHPLRRRHHLQTSIRHPKSKSFLG